MSHNRRRSADNTAMERVSESQMLACMKRREEAAATVATEEDRERLPWPVKRPCGWSTADDCGGEATVRAIKNYCRDRNLPDDVYRPVERRQQAGLCDGKFRLADLVDELHRVFAEDRVNVEYVRYLMESYRSDPAEWLKYAKFSKFRYTRNLVDAGNGKFNLMVLCWGEGHGSSIHDHPSSECVMKMLAGQLTEVRFAWPASGRGDGSGSGDDDDDDDQLQPMYETGRTILETDGVCHINGAYSLCRHD